jgi:hypothetical protein
LLQVYPNPFNPVTTITYQLATSGIVNLAVYDITGRKVTELVAGWREVGVHNVNFNAYGLPSGVYFAHLKAGDFQRTLKLLLID